MWPFPLQSRPTLIHIYKERNYIERFFNRIKSFRRIATRYDKTAVMFLGSLTLVSIILWLKL